MRALPMPSLAAPAPLSPPRALSPPSSPPRARPAPGISAAVAVRAADSSSPSPGRLSSRSERAAPRSSAHWSRPVSPGPSRRQPRGVASPAHPPGRRGAGGGRDPGAPTPPPEVGRGPRREDANSPEVVCGRAGGEGARAGARDAAAALRPGGRGGGERALGARRAPQ